MLQAIHDVDASSEPLNYEDSLFRVVHQLSYDAQKQLEKRFGSDSSAYHPVQAVHDAVDDAVDEIRRNDEAMRRQRGPDFPVACVRGACATCARE